MRVVICFLVGLGLQELLIIAFFLVLLGTILIILVIVIKKNSQRKNLDLGSSAEKMAAPDNSVILKNANKLKELKSLQEKGIISNEEFEAEKKKILES
jgi:hypothetical protein